MEVSKFFRLTAPVQGAILLMVSIIAASLILFEKATFPRVFAFTAILWTILILAVNIRRIIRKWRQALLFVCTAILGTVVLWLAGPFIMRTFIVPEHQHDIDHRFLPLPGERNEDGILPDIPAKNYEEGDFNIIFMGDSFTYGYRLNDPFDSFPFMVEKELKKQSAIPVVKVVNFAWTNSSPILHLRQLREIGKKYHPDLIVHAIDMTDFSDDIGFTEGLERSGLDSPKQMTIFEAMAIWIALRLELEDRLTLPASFISGDTDKPSNILRPPGPPNRFRYFHMWQPLKDSEPFFKSTWNSIVECAELAEQMGAAYVVFVLPRYQQYNRNQCLKVDHNGTESDRIPLSDEYMFEAFKFFEEKSKNSIFPIYSLLEDFQKTALFPTVFNDDLHYNEAGHEVAAKGIVRMLLKDGLIPFVQTTD